MAAPSLTYTLVNGTTADASQVMQNFNDILNGVSDGTKDLSLNALTLAGTLTANGTVNVGNASADDLVVNASLASTIPIKTTNSFDIGSTTLGLRALYFGANSQTVNVKGSASMSATWTLTLPVTAGTNNYLLITNGSGVSSWASISSTGFFATASDAGTVSTTTQSFAGVKSFDDGVTIGSSSADDLTVNASLASTIPIKTTNSFDIGTSTLGLRALYLGANSQTVNVKGSASMSATWTMTLPVTAGTAGYALVTNGSGVTSWSKEYVGTATNDSATAGYLGEQLSAQVVRSAATSVTTATDTGILSTNLTAGDWDVYGSVGFTGTSTDVAYVAGCINTANAIHGNDDSDKTAQIRLTAGSTISVASNDTVLVVPPQRMSLASTTTVRLVVRSNFGTNAVNSYGTLRARRVR